MEEIVARRLTSFATLTGNSEEAEKAQMNGPFEFMVRWNGLRL
jgi:hypothetical protein